MDIVEYRKTSLTFRRIASNMLNSTYDEGNLQLIRFRNYIQDNKIINAIIENKIDGVEAQGNFISDEDDGYWYTLNIPIDEAEHIKSMYYYLIEMTEEEKDLRGVAVRFHHSDEKWNDIIRSYLEKVFKPLVDFIVDSLSMEMMIMEPEKNETHIHQSINNNYGTANVAQGNICSTNKANVNDINNIIKLISEIKGTINNIEEIDTEEKEEVFDDLEVIQEQIQNDNPKYIKLKKAYQGVKNFIAKLPEHLTEAILITTKINELGQSVQPLLEQIRN